MRDHSDTVGQGYKAGDVLRQCRIGPVDNSCKLSTLPLSALAYLRIFQTGLGAGPCDIPVRNPEGESGVVSDLFSLTMGQGYLIHI